MFLRGGGQYELSFQNDLFKELGFVYNLDRLVERRRQDFRLGEWYIYSVKLRMSILCLDEEVDMIDEGLLFRVWRKRGQRS